jgi:hypothetical protein
MKKIFYSLGLSFMALFLFSSMEVKAQTPSITLLQPTDPGIEWTVGGTYVISWVDNFSNGVDVLVSDNNGSTYTTIASDVSGSTYYWNTTGYAIGHRYKIKVRSHLAPSYYSRSAHRFKLVDQAGGFITMEQPTGNETWAEGSTYLISWDDNLSAPVTVELLKNNTPYSVISASTTGSTLYWTIPTGLANNSKIYKIRVSSTVPNATTPPATSGRFKISASAGTFVEVYQPNGGERWARGTTHLISWNDDIPEPVNIELYKGSTKVSDIATNVVGSTYSWTIDPTQTVANNYRVYVRSTLDPTHLYDRSNGHFRITASGGTFVEVYQPNGGENWARGTTHLISWNDDLTEPVNVELYKGSTKVADIATNVVGSTYWWTIDPTITTANNYKIYVRSTLDPTHLYDRSNSRFHITASAGSFVEVIQPNGGESWARGTAHLISWNDDLSEPVNIELYQGSTKVSDIATNVTGSTYSWAIDPTLATGNNYRIYVRSTLDPTHLYDKSDTKFHITASGGTYVAIYQPNGGETWARGTSHLISWNDDFQETVNIELWKGGSFSSTIASNVSGSTYSWDIPTTTTPGTNYKVKIYSTVDGALKDFSDANFTIAASAGTFVTIIQPNGGEVLQTGSSYLISWNDDLPEAVNIELWKGGSFNSTIQNNATGSTFSWNIPSGQTTGTNYKVKIYSTLDNTIKDFSDGNFTIESPPPMISAYPNPANSQVTIHMKNMAGSNFTIQLYNRFNVAIGEYQSNSGSMNIPTSNLSDGIYFVVVTSDKTRATTKIIVQH